MQRLRFHHRRRTLRTDWSDTELKLFDHVAAASLRGWPVAIGFAALNRAQRWIKQTPAVWDAATKVRAFVASMKGGNG
jgi:CelD/BcsL family acetyltransferase involved in cellulose biosynthesis